MKREFWIARWEAKNIGFHRDDVNPVLVEHFEILNRSKDARIFLPLCGKSRDIAWLMSKRLKVVGVEFSELAVQQLFAENHLVPAIEQHGRLKRYSAEGIIIFVGDFFDLDSEMLGPVQAVYDRAAYVALPEEMRRRYAEHLTGISANAPQLLVTYDYDQAVMEGPPFAIPETEIHENYGQGYKVRCLQSVEVSGGSKGVCPAKEMVWQLSQYQN